jgi:hypothetical protein
VIGSESGDAFLSGVEAGIARAERYDLRIDRPEELTPERENWERLGEFTRGLLERAEASDRFIELFAEMLSVASIARYAYSDPVLTESDIESYLEHSYLIFNSFRHA